MKRICIEAGIPEKSLKKITNHSGRATLASCLHNNDIQNQLVMEKGGWRSSEGAARYKHTSSAQKLQLDNILHEHSSGASRPPLAPLLPVRAQPSVFPTFPGQQSVLSSASYSHLGQPHVAASQFAQMHVPVFQQQPDFFAMMREQLARGDAEIRDRYERCERDCQRLTAQTQENCRNMIKQAEIDIIRMKQSQPYFASIQQQMEVRMRQPQTISQLGVSFEGLHLVPEHQFNFPN
jgi:hypothetical protein